MYAALRQQIDIPAEWQNQHFRRQLVSYLVDNARELEPLLRDGLAGIYGLREEDRGAAGQHSGPFSYKKYCSYMARVSSWGDELTLRLISMMWNLRITVITVNKAVSHLKIRHNEEDLDKVDLLLLYNGSTHYSKIGEFFLLSLVLSFPVFIGRTEGMGGRRRFQYSSVPYPR
jgi:hypothetical protein